jgi:hypothetical protein
MRQGLAEYAFLVAFLALAAAGAVAVFGDELRVALGIRPAAPPPASAAAPAPVPPPRPPP